MKRVILVDDESEVRSVVRDFAAIYFEESGVTCEIESLDDPVEALFRISDDTRCYDAILLDVRMPTMGGDDIYQALDALDGDLTQCVLFVTAFPGDLLSRYSDRVLHVLSKPFTFEEFSAAMDALLQRNDRD